MKELGFTDDDLDTDLEVLTENLPAVRVFIAMQTQWRHGMGGPTGLDYAALPVVEARCGVRREKRGDVFAAVRVMECETLNAWAERRQRK